jgi:NAD(P)-dependent dehydrogenase (short-subunit alcohol dehydrogenase family)
VPRAWPVSNAEYRPYLTSVPVSLPGFVGSARRPRPFGRASAPRGSNTISPGIIFHPLAKDELTGPRGEGYRRMIELSPVGRGGTPDEVGTVGALLMGPDGAFITGSDFLMDGGVIAS